MDQAEMEAARQSQQALEGVVTPFKKILRYLTQRATDRLSRAGERLAGTALGKAASAVKAGLDRATRGVDGMGWTGIVSKRGAERAGRRAGTAYRPVPDGMDGRALDRVADYMAGHKGCLSVCTDPKTGLRELVYPANQERLVANAVEYALGKAVGERKGRAEGGSAREKKPDRGCSAQAPSPRRTGPSEGPRTPLKPEHARVIGQVEEAMAKKAPKGSRAGAEKAAHGPKRGH